MADILPYRLLDSGNCRKLEQAGPYRIIRPALNAFWKPTLPQKEWDNSSYLPFTRCHSVFLPTRQKRQACKYVKLRLVSIICY